MPGKTKKDSKTGEESKSGLFSKLTSAGLRAVDSKNQHWTTPWSWVDQDRMYYGDDGFWLYRQLPIRLLYDDLKELKNLLAELNRQLPGRQIHLLQYQWSAPAQLPDDTPAQLQELLGEMRELHTPLRSLILGVKLQPAPPSKLGFFKSMKKDLWDSIDILLKEDVPEFDSTDADRAVVSGILMQFGATSVSGEAAGHLEGWYLLGASTDPVVVENETSIDFGNTSILTCLSVCDVVDEGKPTPLPAVGPNAVICLSLRGTLASNELLDTSVVLARRASGAGSWVTSAGAALKSATVQLLPLRQLPALSETLPGSSERVTPKGVDLTFNAFKAIGLCDPISAGDRMGLSLGMVGPNYADLCWWNPSKAAGQVMAIAGGPKSGKTVLAEYLAMQALTCGFAVRYISGDGEAGRPLVTLARSMVTPVAGSRAGLCNPGPFPHDNELRTELAGILHSLVKDIPRGAWMAMLSVPDPDDYQMTVPFDKLVTFAPDRETTARMIREVRANPLVAMLLAPTEFPPGSVAVAVPRVLKDILGKYRPLAEDLLVATSILAPSNQPLIVVADQVNLGEMTKHALDRSRKEGRAVTFIGIGDSPKSLEFLEAGFKVATAAADLEASKELLAWVGVLATVERQAWLRDAAPRIHNKSIISAPVMLLSDDQDLQSPLVVAPLPTALLETLTRVPGMSYRS